MTVTKNYNLIAIQNGKPTTPDPLLADVLPNMDFYNTVRLSLVGNSKRGEITPLLASSWTNSQNYTHWELTLRDDLYFDNGDKITPREVFLSLKRIFKLIISNNSFSNIASNIKGIKKLKTIETDIDGLTLSKNKINFEFERSIPNFLELISLPQYSIVSSSDYDKKTLIWKNNKTVNASGFYKVSEITDQYGILTKRKTPLWSMFNFHTSEQIIIYWNIESAKSNLSHDLDKIEIYPFSALNKNDEIPKNIIDLSYSKDIDQNTLFFKFINWNVKNNPTNNKEVRQNLRDLFEILYQQNDFKSNVTSELLLFTRSFISNQVSPTTPMIVPEKNPNNQRLSKLTENLKLAFNKRPLKIKSPYSNLIYTNAFISFLTNYLKKHEIQFNLVDQPFTDEWFQNLTTEQNTDLILISSSIYTSHPVDDLKFMFLSKEGLAHPDINGYIKKILFSDNVNFAAINDYIWDTAVFIPILQYSKGYKISKRINIDRRNSLIDGFPWHLVELLD